MENYRDKFIKAEERANKLADQLQKLKDETENYRQANTALDSTKDRLIDLINQIESVVEEERELIDALEKIGLQEILDRINQSENSILSDVASQLDEQNEEVKSIASAFSKEILRIRKKINRVQIYIYVTAGLILIMGIVLAVVN